MKKIDKLWGHEIIMVNNEKYCLKHLYLKRGYQCSLHYHKKKDETFVVLIGKVELEHNNEIKILKINDTIRIKQGEKHRFKALSNTAILAEVSTTDDAEDSYRLEVSCEV